MPFRFFRARNFLQRSEDIVLGRKLRKQSEMFDTPIVYKLSLGRLLHSIAHFHFAG